MRREEVINRLREPESHVFIGLETVWAHDMKRSKKGDIGYHPEWFLFPQKYILIDFRQTELKGHNH